MWYDRKSKSQTAFPSDPEKGDGLDFGRWYRCQICGQICKEGRDELGGSESLHGAVYEYLVLPASGGDPETSIACMLGDFIALKAQQDGTAEPIAFNISRDMENSRGCPLCGSTNWRGDY